MFPPCARARYILIVVVTVLLDDSFPSCYCFLSTILMGFVLRMLPAPGPAVGPGHAVARHTGQNLEPALGLHELSLLVSIITFVNNSLS